MPKVKVKLHRIAGLTPDGRSPFLDALSRACQEKMPAKTFYWLNKLTPIFEREINDISAAHRNLVEKLGVKTVTGWQVPPERQKEFADELKTLEREIELPLDEGVKLELPANGVAADWLHLMNEVDIFAEPK